MNHLISVAIAVAGLWAGAIFAHLMPIQHWCFIPGLATIALSTYWGFVYYLFKA